MDFLGHNTYILVTRRVPPSNIGCPYIRCLISASRAHRQYFIPIRSPLGLKSARTTG